MLLYRVLSALVGIPVILYFFWQGGLPLFAFISVLTILSVWEFQTMMTKAEDNPSLGLILLGSLFLLGAAYLNREGLLGFIITGIVILTLMVLIFKHPQFKTGDAGLTLFGIFYIGWLFSHLYLVRTLPSGTHYAFLTLAATWATDTGAYFAGRSFGNRKLAPMLSPKKTVEGAIGGVVGALIISLAFSMLGHAHLYHYLILGILLGIISQLGDLIESGIKRMAGVKDSGHIIPGHGGVLDRFDSMLLTAPLVYYYALVFILS